MNTKTRKQAIEELNSIKLGEDVGAGGYTDTAAYKLANSDIDAKTEGLSQEVIDLINVVGSVEFEEIGR